MREIKFKIWDGIDYMTNPITLFDIQNEALQFTSDVIFLQFTGLHDKNGKDIYEGHVVQCSYGKGSVEFYHGCFMVEWIDDKEANMELLTMRNDGRFRCENDQFEIIGNIYENPELLK